jgi:molybdate transport system substrate-binding protein
VPQKEITVSAAISLKDVLDQIAQLYRGEMPDTVVHFNLGASGTLQRQIEEGAPMDVFVSASEDQMNSLESKGAGIVYVTAAQTSPEVSVVTTAPEDSHSQVIYPVGRFLDFLAGEKAQRVFERYGFKPAGE